VAASKVCVLLVSIRFQRGVSSLEYVTDSAVEVTPTKKWSSSGNTIAGDTSSLARRPVRW